MAVVSRSIEVEGASVADAEALWYDVGRWVSFVDGFGDEVERSDDWPRAGATLTWESLRGGRGRVELHVVDYRPGEGQRVDVADPHLTGTERVVFSATADGVEVAYQLDYTLVRHGPLSRLADLLFIRRSLRDSLARTLERFAVELEAELAAAC